MVFLRKRGFVACSTKQPLLFCKGKGMLLKSKKTQSQQGLLKPQHVSDIVLDSLDFPDANGHVLQGCS